MKRRRRKRTRRQGMRGERGEKNVGMRDIVKKKRCQEEGNREMSDVDKIKKETRGECQMKRKRRR